MQTGAVAEAAMMALFAPQAVYIEPFSGEVRTHRGKEAIRDVLREGWSRPLPDIRIEVDTVDIAGEKVTSQWTCYSPGIPGGKGSGVNTFVLKDGLIVRLQTRFITPKSKESP
jgi:hypothetical protein